MIGIGANLTQGYSSGGSVNNATSWMNTDAMSARQYSDYQAAIAFERQKELQLMAQEFNAAEAEKARNFNSAEATVSRDWNSAEAKASRQWQENMANTVYTRSVANMREAGINPILAANMGLSGASVGSGATASMGAASGGSASVGAGSAPMAQSFMDTTSGSQASGSSWQHSESGLATALQAMGAMISAALGAINAGSTLQIVMDQAGDFFGATPNSIKEGTEMVKKIMNGDLNWDEEAKKSIEKGIVNIVTPEEQKNGKPNYSWEDRKDSWYNPMVPTYKGYKR